jgi:hypothetical protein
MMRRSFAGSVLAPSLTLLLVAFGAQLPGGAQSLVTAPQFSAGESERLRSIVQIPVVIPVSLPPGYRVAKVDVSHPPFRTNGTSGPPAENYMITYARGSATMAFGGTNWTAGGDPSPDVFTARFRSNLFGDGIVHLTDRGDVKCWSAYVFEKRANGTSLNFFMAFERGLYTAQGCDHAVSAAQFAQIVESLRAARGR